MYRSDWKRAATLGGAVGNAAERVAVNAMSTPQVTE